MNEMPLKGNFREAGFPKILTFLNRYRKTGTLIVSTPVFTKKVFLVKGDAIFASSTYEDDRFGEMLIKAGKITLEQYEESVKLLKQQKGKRQGAILVELGYLTPKDLFWGVKYQVKEIIYSLFMLEDASYEFIEEEIPADEVITLKMSMGNLIYEGVKRVDNWTRIRNEMPGTDTVLKLSSDPASLFQDVELSPEDRRMLSLINGTKSIKDIIDSAWGGSFEGMKILYVLWSIGVLEEREKAPSRVETLEKVGKSVALEEILQPVSEDEHSLMMKVDELYMNLPQRNAYELLEVDENSDEETLNRNYYRLAREFHPDRYFSASDPSIKDKLNAIFDALSSAYESLKEKKSGIPLEKAHPEKSAEEYFARGVEEFKRGDFQKALNLFRSSTQAEPGNARFWSYLSLSCSKVPNMISEAEKASFEAIKLEPQNAEHYANLGLIYLVHGRKKNAREQFEKALEIDPENLKASKGIRKAGS